MNISQVVTELAKTVCDQRIEDAYDDTLNPFVRSHAFTLGLRACFNQYTLTKREVAHCAGILAIIREASGDKYVPTTLALDQNAHIDAILPIILDADHNDKIRIYSPYEARFDLDQAKKSLRNIGLLLRWHKQGKYWYCDYEHAPVVWKALQDIQKPELVEVFRTNFAMPPEQEYTVNTESEDAEVVVTTKRDKNGRDYYCIRFIGHNLFENKDKFLNNAERFNFRQQCKWNKKSKVWQVFNPLAPAIVHLTFNDNCVVQYDDKALKQIQATSKIIEDAQKDKMDALKLKQQLNEEVASKVDEFMDNLALPNIKLYQFQEEDTRAALKAGLGLGHEQGLGKGVMGAVMAKFYAEVMGYHVLVIAPAALVSHWNYAISNFVKHEARHLIHVTTQHYRSMPQVEYLVKDGNKERWHNYVHRRWHEDWSRTLNDGEDDFTKTKRRTNVWRIWLPKEDVFITQSDTFVMITDECDNFGEMNAGMTKVWHELSRYCNIKHPLSGTMMGMGVPKKLAPLLYHMQSPFVTDMDFNDNTWGYFKRFCDLKRIPIGNGRTIWNMNGRASDQEMMVLHKHLQELAIRRTDKIIGVPPNRIVITRVPDASQEEITVYESALKSKWQEYNNRIKAGVIKSGTEDLVLIGHQRQASSLAKAAFTAERAVKILEQGDDAVVIFVAFRATVNAVYGLIKKGMNDINQDVIIHQITGEGCTSDVIDKSGTGFIKRTGHEVQEAFQNDPGKHVILATIDAAHAGFTFTRARYCIMNDWPWSASVLKQALKRVSRNTQTRDTITICPLWDTFDYAVMERVIDRIRTLDMIIDGLDTDLERLLVFEGKPEVVGQYTEEHINHMMKLINRSVKD